MHCADVHTGDEKTKLIVDFATIILLCNSHSHSHERYHRQADDSPRSEV
jgi:hypothetical protein